MSKNMDDHEPMAEVAQLRERFKPAQLHAKLVPPANAALERAMEREGLSRSDMVNRLIQIGAFVLDKMAEGNQVVIRRPDGETETVHIV